MTGRPNRHFVDTNILVYAHDASSGTKHERAKSAILDLWKTGTGCLSIQVLQEFYVVVTQKVPHPIHWTEAQRIISDLSVWQIHMPSATDVLRAIEIQHQQNLSFWDAMIIQSASQLGCSCILTEDLNSGQMYGSVKAINPLLDPCETLGRS